MPPDLPERVTVLEKLFERVEQRLSRIEERLERFELRVEQRLDEIDRRLAELRGMLSERPTMWQLITYTLGAQVTLAGLLFAAYKLGH
jgi:tetrahydromethanopterin S-methyltransferase subunit G